MERRSVACERHFMHFDSLSCAVADKTAVNGLFSVKSKKENHLQRINSIGIVPNSQQQAFVQVQDLRTETVALVFCIAILRSNEKLNAPDCA